MFYLRQRSIYNGLFSFLYKHIIQNAWIYPLYKKKPCVKILFYIFFFCNFIIYIFRFASALQKEMHDRPIFGKMNLVFLLATCANSLVDSFPYKYMLFLWSLIWSNRVWGSWYVIIWLEITVHCSAMDFRRVAFSDWLEEVIVWNFLFGQFLPIILQKFQSLSNQSYKHISVHMPSLNLTLQLSFELKCHMFIINVYYTKSKHLQSLHSLLKIFVGF